MLLLAVANRASIAQQLLDLGKPPGTPVACTEHAATAQAYQWLWEDLWGLHMVQQVPPIGED